MTTTALPLVSLLLSHGCTSCRELAPGDADRLAAHSPAELAAAADQLEAFAAELRRFKQRARTADEPPPAAPPAKKTAAKKTAKKTAEPAP